MKPLHLVLLCLLAASSAPIVSPQDDTPSLGDLARQERARRQQNADANEIANLKEADFHANILLTDSHAATEKWVLTPAAERATTGRIREVSPDKKIYVPVVISEYPYETLEMMNLTAHIRVTAPNGRVIFEHPRISEAIAPDPRSPHTIVLNRVMDITFDPHDVPGTYTFHVTVTDHVHSTYAKAEEQLQLIQDKPSSADTPGKPAAPVPALQQ